MIRKEPVLPQRVRRPPREGFSWVDRRFLREHAPALSREAVLVYFFYCAVADRDGLSYWGEAAAAARLKLDEPSLERARDELSRRDLVAWREPLVQVLALPPTSRPAEPRKPEALGEVLGRLGGRP